MAKGVQRDPRLEAFWRGAIARQVESGWSVAEFCRRERLRVSSFYYWKREIERRDRELPASGFVSVVVRETAAAGKPIVVELAGGTRIILEPGFDAETLRRAAVVLGGGSC